VWERGAGHERRGGVARQMAMSSGGAMAVRRVKMLISVCAGLGRGAGARSGARLRERRGQI
jgi:hypothetical protein